MWRWIYRQYNQRKRWLEVTIATQISAIWQEKRGNAGACRSQHGSADANAMTCSSVLRAPSPPTTGAGLVVAAHRSSSDLFCRAARLAKLGFLFREAVRPVSPAQLPEDFV